MADAEKISYLAFTALPSNATMAQARGATEAVAATLGAQQLQSTIDAWCAVGVGACEEVTPVTNPTVTINQASGQGDPTNDTTINFDVEFSEPVSGFDSADVTLDVTAPGTITASVTGGPTTYDVAVSGMAGDGTVIATIAAGVASSIDTSETNLVSTSADNTVTYDTTAPTVAGADPSSGAGGVPIGANVVVTFSEPVNSDTVLASSFTVDNGTTIAGAIEVAADGLSVTFTPSGDLAPETTYTVTVTTVVTDLAGNNMAANFTSSFTTAVAPTEATTFSIISITYTTSGGKNSDKHLNVTVALVDDLDNPVGGASVSIDLKRGGSTIASGTASTGGGGTVTFTLNNAASGCYTEALGVTHPDLTWDLVTPDSLPEDPFRHQVVTCP